MKQGFASDRGFTLIELMIVIAVLGVLLTLAMPNFRDFIDQQRLKGASFELQSALTLARSEAIKRGATSSVVVEAKSAVWANGWEVKVDGSTSIIQQAGAIERVTITETGSRTKVTYTGSGRADAAYAFSLSVPGNTAVTARCVRIDTAGMPYSKIVATGGCS